MHDIDSLSLVGYRSRAIGTHKSKISYRRPSGVGRMPHKHRTTNMREPCFSIGKGLVHRVEVVLNGGKDLHDLPCSIHSQYQSMHSGRNGAGR